MPLTPEEGIRIKANNIYDAANEILGVLEDPGIGNFIYFEGWDGLGASAALKVLSQRLKLSKLKFDKVIHVDCSMWKSQRALQKVIARELKLPESVMATFDQCDEDDDFKGIDEGSRGLIMSDDVTRMIYQKLVGIRFMVIFHNGSSGYVDLTKFGIPLYPFLENKLLWTFQGRFRPHKQVADDREIERIMGNTNVYLYATLIDRRDGDGGSKLWDIVHEEAQGVAEYTGMPQCIDHRTMEDCILYMWALQDMDGIKWGTHASNYWVCDGIIKAAMGRTAWEVGDALQSCMYTNWNWDYMENAVMYADIHLKRDVPRRAPVYCSSSSSLLKVTNLPSEASSFLIAGADEASTIILPSGMFRHSDSSKLQVLHLSFCTFSFTSPPFLCCRNLRFLLLNHCNDDDPETKQEDRQIHNQSKGEPWKACFGKLWVLDLSYTDWYQLLSEEMMKWMVDLRELNMNGDKNWSICNLHCNGNGILVKLRVIVDDDSSSQENVMVNPITTNDDGTYKPKIIMFDNCIRLEQVVLVNNVAALGTGGKSEGGGGSKISAISFRRCFQLKSVIMRGFFGIVKKLDLSGTLVKTLDLSEVEFSCLTELILLGCEQLCAILWPQKGLYYLEVMRIDNTRSLVSCEDYWKEKTKAKSTTRQWFLSIRDARLLRSLLLPIQYNFSASFSYVSIYIEMDSPPSSTVRETNKLKKLPYSNNLYARDAIFQDVLHDCADNEGVVTWVQDCPRSPDASSYGSNCYLHLQDEEDMKRRTLHDLEGSTGGTASITASATNLPSTSFICDNTRMLHVHDCLSLTRIPFSSNSTWSRLVWCRVERCPQLQSVFINWQRSNRDWSIFDRLQTLWVSQLVSARDIWNHSSTSQHYKYSFGYLELLHLDYCPKLVYVLPLSIHMTSLGGLTTLEIVCCGNLREIFPSYQEQEEETVLDFPSLKQVHLHELPMLQHICRRRMRAPSLVSIQIRGCWSLRRLPAIGEDTKPPPKVDCEKEWWDNLKWDGLKMNHHPSLYQPSHSLYNKKAKLPRSTILR